ncbi:MAG: hypothetical protein GY928_35355 [Colwellia sp.]|nr:hypothetical protein [Colwellia sp.]
MAINCCNGRVGKRIMELAVKDDKLSEYIKPTGIDIIEKVAKLGGDVSESLNCCNGKVGRKLNLQEVASKLAGGE